MKSYINKIIFGALLIVVSSCGDFFEESSQSEIKPSTIEDLAAVLYAEAYPYNVSTDAYLILLTDEVQCNGLTNDAYADNLKSGQPVFCFDDEMFDGIKSFVSDENSWKTYYELIMGCNVIMDNVDDMDGDATSKRYVKGQALFLRGYYYLKLATIYCQPYRNNPESNLGVPLMLTSHVSDQFPSRSTLKETYAQIESDVKEAAELLEGYEPTTKFRVTKTAAHALLSRIYLFEENWEQTVYYANLAIDEGPLLSNFSSLQSSSAGVCDANSSSEVVWNYQGRVIGATYFTASSSYWGYTKPFTLSNSVKSLYDSSNDLRYNLFKDSYSSDYCFIQKNSFSETYSGEHGIRMAEVYLNRAEANARLGKTSSALADINKLRETRYASGTYNDVSISDQTELLNFVLDERQREYVWEEGLRWMDIKRLGLAVTHTYVDAEGNSSTYNLSANDPLYALPIPQDALSRNENLVQNPR